MYRARVVNEMMDTTTKIRMDRASAAEAIKQLDEADLMLLNRLIVERLKLIRQAQAIARLSEFATGDRVGFQDRQGRYHRGRVVRLNQKTITVNVDDGRQWKVSPMILDRLGHPSDQMWG